jgi:hypothetical protein
MSVEMNAVGFDANNLHGVFERSGFNSRDFFVGSEPPSGACYMEGILACDVRLFHVLHPQLMVGQPDFGLARAKYLFERMVAYTWPDAKVRRTGCRGQALGTSSRRTEAATDRKTNSRVRSSAGSNKASKSRRARQSRRRRTRSWTN